jgi:membrane-bound inhibitor of C-type lysozyme
MDDHRNNSRDATPSDAPRKVRRSRPGRRTRWAPAAAAVVAVVAVAGCSAASSDSAGAASPSPSVSSASASAGQGRPGGGDGSNARSGPAAGGSAGTVDSTSASDFALTTSAGQKVTVDETSSTTYEKGTAPASAADVTKGDNVLVLGTTDGTTITAAQVVVQPADSGSTSSTAGQVIPFERGAPSTSKTVGQVPADYSEGSGTVVDGTTAYRATEAALAAYPGGIVDRVVKLGDGEYEVHNIGVNWPHHIFVDQHFKVVGAE